MQFSAQECFDLACGYYNDAKSIIIEMGSKVQQVKPDFSIKGPLIHFDWILQTILVGVAAIDGNYLKVENDFIQKITDFGDVLYLFNEKVRSSDQSFPGVESWDQLRILLQNMNPDQAGKFMVILVTMVKEYADQFVFYFSKIDAVLGANYMKKLDELISQIILVFTGVDGDDISQIANPKTRANVEFLFGNKIKKMLFSQKWQEMSNSENRSNMSTGTTSSNSLKANFLKKKG